MSVAKGLGNTTKSKSLQYLKKHLMKKNILNFLHFSRKERLGAFTLLSLCISVFATPAILRWVQPPRTTDFSAFEATMQAFRQSATIPATVTLFDFDPNTATEEDFNRLGLSEKVAQNICHFREKGGSFRKPEDFKKIWSLQPKDYSRLLPYVHIGMKKDREAANADSTVKPELFSFDPNTATEADFKKLGLPGRTTHSILNYREKGGVFRKKEDLAKIYTLSSEDYTRLEPFVNLQTPYSSEKKTSYNAATGSVEYFRKSRSTGPIDINQAGVETWMNLPMIGEKRAQQIVKFREKLGGFRSIDQLAEMYNLPDSVFQRIKPQLVVEAFSTHTLNINSASAEALDAHPYISKKQADLIIAYRTQHGNFVHKEDILHIKAFTDKAWWDKVSPYLSTE
jgi:DNA uptake protein ComE-like DNA-binding protein